MLSEDEKAIQFYKRFIEAEEQELEWMYRENEEYYKDTIEQKELLIKGWRNILNLITKLQKENEEKDKQLDLIIEEFYKKMKISTNCYIQRKRGTEQCLNHKNCKECLKQYFEKLAKEEGE